MAGVAQSPGVSAEQALALLIAGNDRFVRGEGRAAAGSGAGGVNPQTLEKLAAGQQPFATILGCSDSRVPPEWVFDVGLGELFVIRVAGNVFSPEVAGSLQYAAEHLQTRLFVVLGHEGCGAVDAALGTMLQGTQHRSRIQILINCIVPGLIALPPANGGDPQDMLNRAVEANVRWTVRQISSAATRVGHARVVGAVYELQSGRVRFLSDDVVAAPRRIP